MENNKPFFIRLKKAGRPSVQAIVDMRAIVCIERRHENELDMYFVNGTKLSCYDDEARAVWGILNETARSPEDVKGGKQLETYP